MLRRRQKSAQSIQTPLHHGVIDGWLVDATSPLLLFPPPLSTFPTFVPARFRSCGPSRHHVLDLKWLLLDSSSLKSRPAKLQAFTNPAVCGARLKLETQNSLQNPFKLSRPQNVQAFKLSTCRHPHQPHLGVHSRPQFECLVHLKSKQNYIRRVWTARTLPNLPSCPSFSDSIIATPSPSPPTWPSSSHSLPLPRQRALRVSLARVETLLVSSRQHPSPRASGVHCRGGACLRGRCPPRPPTT
ncbi:hypothetical protein B0H10DRAFT_232132 [Mycena sp. CBHHK59/15]|nr:hypothetical protein B0H10DRAFT_232132 [Mycena sp. CBHHK59/15]